MKTIPSIFILIIIINLTSSCSQKMNTLSVDKEFCKKVHLREIDFSVEYPNTFELKLAEEGKKNTSYLELTKKNEDGVIQEGIYFSSYQLKDKNQNVVKGSFTDNSISNMLEKQTLSKLIPAYQNAYNLTYAKVEEVVLNGNTLNVLRMKGSSKYTEYGMQGNYFIQAFVHRSKNENHLFLLFLAHENTGIQSFDDFINNSKIETSTIWNTIKFKNNDD